MTEKTHKQLSEEYDHEMQKLDDLHFAVSEAKQKLEEHIEFITKLSHLALEAKRKETGASALEIAFKSAVDEHLPSINAHIALAKEELDKAKAIAEKHGLMFKSSIIDLSDYNNKFKPNNDIYRSKSFIEKYNEIESRHNLFSYLKTKFGVDVYSGFGNRFSDTWLGCWAPSSMSC